MVKILLSNENIRSAGHEWSNQFRSWNAEISREHQDKTLLPPLHSLSTGTPFMCQVMDGLGVPLARQVSTPFSPGARTRFLGVPPIQYGAAEKEREGEGRRINHRALPRRHRSIHQQWECRRRRIKGPVWGDSAASNSDEGNSASSSAADAVRLSWHFSSCKSHACYHMSGICYH